MGKYIEDYTQLLITLRRFEAYISEIDGTNTNIGISFKEGILDCEEGYKSSIIIPKARLSAGQS